MLHFSLRSLFTASQHSAMRLNPLIWNSGLDCSASRTLWTTMKISVHPFELKLKDPFTISRGTVTVQPTLIVRVEHEGYVGLGEATTNKYYGVTLEGMKSALQTIENEVENYELDNPMELWNQLDPKLSQSRFAQAALDCAVWDIYAQMHQQPLWKLWGLHQEDTKPPTCFTIGLASPEDMERKLAENAGYPVYKIKLDSSGGIDLVERLRRCTNATFRVDANCSWPKDKVLGWAAELAELGVELIEQPLQAHEYEAMRDLKGKSPIPLMADESCQVDEDVEKCIPSFDAINIKLVKCGGLSPARRMIARAKQKDLKVMVGCMTESSVGISAGVHLLPLLDFADLDGALLLEQDIATGLNCINGQFDLPAKHGLGVQLTA